MKYIRKTQANLRKLIEETRPGRSINWSLNNYLSVMDVRKLITKIIWDINENNTYLRGWDRPYHLLW